MSRVAIEKCADYELNNVIKRLEKFNKKKDF